MSQKVISLKGIQPGIQRDGTVLDAPSFVAGKWVRFQHSKRPRKIGGYKGIFQNAPGISRGMIMNSQNGQNYFYSGFMDSLQYWITDVDDGVGSGPYAVSITSGFTANQFNLWQFDIGFDAGGSGFNSIIAHPGQNLYNIDSTVNTPVLYGSFPGGALSPVGQFTVSVLLNSTTLAVVTGSDTRIGAGQLVTGTGIPANTTVVSAVPSGGNTNVTLSHAATVSTTETVTIDNQISVSGGCMMMYPYLFVFGNNGLIQNCSAGNFQDWVSADSNANNVATGKIVAGLPVRGGSNSPSGLFWSLDSLVRVSYAPATLSNGVTSTTTYWKYDLLTCETSLLSSKSIIEYDGIYYWCGVDRFLMYNGVVNEVENLQCNNWFWDNLNYDQRQKVWVSKVPRWGEIWWFYPRGTATECTDAIIYNVRLKIWYDAGEAIGARRSAGVFSQVFRFPIWAGNDLSAGNTVLWQHEVGTDAINLANQDAILSNIETNCLGWVTGGPGVQDQIAGDNNWMRFDKFEPDFVQSGPMNLYITGQSYANDADVVSDPYVYDPTTAKIDFHGEQRREPRLIFESNTLNGNFEMGEVLIHVDVSDVRGTGNP